MLLPFREGAGFIVETREEEGRRRKRGVAGHNLIALVEAISNSSTLLFCEDTFRWLGSVHASTHLREKF